MTGNNPPRTSGASGYTTAPQTMAGRLGNVLYWTGTGIAIVFAMFGAIAAVYGGLFGAGLYWTIGVLARLVGRAVRYVLAGR